MLVLTLIRLFSSFCATQAARKSKNNATNIDQIFDIRNNFGHFFTLFINNSNPHNQTANETKDIHAQTKTANETNETKGLQHPVYKTLITLISRIFLASANK